MTWFEAVVLGVIQGLSEFLPISSSAHILVLSQIFGWGDPGAAFTAVTQIGTEVAVLIYFRRDIARIINAWARSLVNPQWRGTPDARLGWYVILGTIPIVVLGLAFTEQIETVARNLWLTATMLAVFGVLLGLADRFGRKEREIVAADGDNGAIDGGGRAQQFHCHAFPGMMAFGKAGNGDDAVGPARPHAVRRT